MRRIIVGGDGAWSWVIKLLSIALLLVAWQVAATIVASRTAFSDQILPSPIYVFGVSFPGLATYGAGGLGGYDTPSYAGALAVLGRNSLVTLARLLGGTGLGILVGVGLGLLMYWSKILRTVVEPVITVIRNTPLLALMPLFLLWFGGREIGNITFIVFAMSLMIVINTMNAIHHIPPVYGKYARTMGATRWQTTRTVVLPAIIPELAGGIRVILGMAWAITMGAEFLGGQTGLGRILVFSLSYLSVGRMIVVLMVFMFYAMVLYWIFEIARKRLTRWSSTNE